MSRATLPRALVVALLAAGLAAPGATRAGNKADAFEGKIQPVSGQLFVKRHRFELTPLVDLSINDAFFTKYFFGAKLGYHVTEFLSVAAQYTTGITNAAGSAVVCPSNQGCAPAGDLQLYQVPGSLRSMASLEVAWAPVYGKLNVLAEGVGHFDIALLAGADLITYREVLSRADAQAAVDAGAKPPGKTTFGGHVGIGVRLFLTDAVALRWELRDVLYTVPVPNRAARGDASVDLQNQLMTQLGVSIFFPFEHQAGP